jgi:hypothetical protein
MDTEMEEMKRTKELHIFMTQKGILVSIKLSANIASPKGTGPAEADPSQCSVTRTELLMEHETNGRLVKTVKGLTNKWKQSCPV